ncbi:MAG: hypothetical protein QXT63_05365 [Thermoplasmata archaeon]
MWITKIPGPSFTRLNDRFNELKIDLGVVKMSDEDRIIRKIEIVQKDY